ncbi:uncharacterized protein MONOS_5536 [Monocercomonoides exilis]|uniref:uncharacterized protein n=1 Tax=Monocercomonoides exilis TaxID=2049356 RepID=UPI00355941E7|nr:hypothetical protein MONOS_5536 [Monocercomonoides exilis]|eukprot:MONOS_5536.1-p1 / transcript=MONOS_5536.1 / gene=MONOS_5536 / organism=Monocercomonoides_exilis_PA203 / gene_product=unspecified product / transcript_product=unspecified product / location=Mono_scaffold00162:61895-63831(-) / protein_length=603 / sequence_SO=supercontig / SO=protein_coding / is_pseudo=false
MLKKSDGIKVLKKLIEESKAEEQKISKLLQLTKALWKNDSLRPSLISLKKSIIQFVSHDSDDIAFCASGIVFGQYVPFEKTHKTANAPSYAAIPISNTPLYVPGPTIPRPVDLTPPKKTIADRLSFPVFEMKDELKKQWPPQRCLEALSLPQAPAKDVDTALGILDQAIMTQPAAIIQWLLNKGLLKGVASTLKRFVPPLPKVPFGFEAKTKKEEEEEEKIEKEKAEKERMEKEKAAAPAKAKPKRKGKKQREREEDPSSMGVKNLPVIPTNASSLSASSSTSPSSSSPTAAIAVLSPTATLPRIPEPAPLVCRIINTCMKLVNTLMYKCFVSLREVLSSGIPAVAASLTSLPHTHAFPNVDMWSFRLLFNVCRIGQHATDRRGELLQQILEANVVQAFCCGLDRYGWAVNKDCVNGLLVLSKAVEGCVGEKTGKFCFWQIMNYFYAQTFLLYIIKDLIGNDVELNELRIRSMQLLMQIQSAEPITSEYVPAVKQLKIDIEDRTLSEYERNDALRGLSGLFMCEQNHKLLLSDGFDKVILGYLEHSDLNVYKVGLGILINMYKYGSPATQQWVREHASFSKYIGLSVGLGKLYQQFEPVSKQ